MAIESTYNLDDFIPSQDEGGQLIRSPKIDDTTDLNSFKPDSVFQEPAAKGPSLIEGIKSDPLVYGLAAANKAQEGLNSALAVIRWPFRRFIEHPVSTVVTDLQKGHFGTDTLAKAGEAFLPKPIPEQDYGSYGEIWRNYYKATRGLHGEDVNATEPPEWYLAMASFGSAMGIETGALAGAGKITDATLFRNATPKESEIIRAAFEPLKQSLQKKGLDPATLHPDGNIIALNNDSEIFLNKHLSSVLRGDEIRVPRWAKIKMPQAIKPAEAPTTENVPAQTTAEVLPITGKEIVIQPIANNNVIDNAPRENTKTDSIKIPVFENPEHAKDFGRNATPEDIKALRKHYVQIREKAGDLRIKAESQELTNEEIQQGFSIGEQESRIKEALVAAGPDAYKGIFSERKAQDIRSQDIKNQVKKNIPEFTGNDSGAYPSDVYAKEIAGNPGRIKALEDHIAEMKQKRDILQKEDMADTEINKPREQEIARLSSQISLAGDALRKGKETASTPSRWKNFGAEPVAAIPGEPVEFLDADVDLNNAKAVLVENEEGKFYIERSDGTFIYNPNSESALFDTAEQARLAAEKEFPQTTGNASSGNKPPETAQGQATPSPEEKPPVNQMKVGKATTSKVKAQVREATGQIKDQGEMVSERSAFLQSLKDQVRAASESKSATREQIFDIQNAIVDLVSNSDLEANDKAKFLKTIKNVQTTEEFQKVLPEVSKRIVQLETKEQRRDLVKQIQDTVKRAKDSNSVAVDFSKAIESAVGDVDLKTRRPETLESLNRSEEFFKSQIAQGKDVEIPKEMLKKLELLQKKGLDELSTTELKSLLAQIQKMEQLGETKLRARQNLLESQKAKDLELIKKDSKPIVAKEIKKPEIGERLSAQDEFKNKMTEGLNLVQEKNLAISPMDVVFDILDGAKNYKGANFKVFKEQMDVAWSEYLKKRDSLINGVVKLANDSKMNVQNFERIGVHAAREQEGGRQKLLDTGLTEKQIDNVVLTDTEEKLYNAMRKVLDDLRPDIEEVMRVTYNQPLEQVKNYFSFMTDFEAMSDAEIRERFGNSLSEFGLAPKKNVQKGFTISRNLGKQKIKLNAMEIFLKHTDNAAYLVHVGPVNKYLGELAATEEYGQAAGQLGQEIVREWIDLIARKGRAAGDRIGILDTLRKNVGAATLGFKLSSALVQPTSLFHGASMIGTKAFEGAFNIAKSPEWRKFVLNNFPEIKARVGDDPAYMEFGGNTKIDDLQRSSLWALQKLDMLSASSVAAGAYIKAVEAAGGVVDLAKPNLEAIKEAQKIVRRTQSSSFFKDAPSAITQGKLTGNVSLDKFVLQFQSFMLNEFSLIQHDMFRAGFNSGNTAQGLNIAAWLMLATLAEVGIRRFSKELIAFATGEDLKDWGETFGKEVGGQLMGKIPFVSQIVSSANYGSNPVPAVAIVDEIAQRMQAANTAKSQTAKNRNFTRGMMLILGAFGGIPGAIQGEQIIKNLTKEPKKRSF